MHDRIWMRSSNSRTENPKSQTKNPTWLGLSVIAFVFMVTVSEAQQNHKIIRIGILDANSEVVAASRLKAFREGLREFGNFDGQNISMETRYADGKLDRIPALAAELVPAGKMNITVRFFNSRSA